MSSTPHTSIFCVLLLIIGMSLASQSAAAQNDQGLKLTELSVEYFTNPIGIDDTNPRLSWKIESGQRNTKQTSYQIQVAESSDFSDTIWDTGQVNSDQSIHVTYEGPDLQSRKRYYWRARVWDNHGNESGWSDVNFWEMGLLTSDDWQVEWIEPGFEQDTTSSPPSPMFRNEFELKGDVESARVYVTSRGVYKMHINGKRVGNQEFAPGWTSYHNRLQYQTYDITDLLNYGQNAIGAFVGDGWYRGYLVWGDARNHYGKTLGLLAQIEVTYKDGSTEIFGTDDRWRSETGPILKSDIYNGETYDARLDKEGWTQPGYNDSDWSDVQVVDFGNEKIVAPEAPPVRKIQTLKPLEILETPEGDTVVDFGQNLVGWVQISAEGPSGTEIVLEHAEVLDKNGNFYTANLRAADQINRFILKGEGKETYEPHFTFQGFRFVKIEGYPGELTEDDLTAVVLHSDMDPTGHFQTSNSLINQLQHNIVWGQKGNFLDVPTDCPQRDERLGWTGDIQVFASTACFNMDASGFLTKWLRDVDADQNEDGSVPYVVPNVLGEQAAGASGWGDASVIVPWALYKAYGDEQILETQYESMKGWVEFMKNRAAMDSTTYLWDNNFTFGDWLSFNTTASDYPGAYTDKALISTAFFAHSTDLLSKSAEILGKMEDVEEYSELFENIKKEFQQEYLTSSGRIMSNTQTAYLLALQFNLLSDDLKADAADYLVERIDERGHLTTGFLGTPHLNPILTQYGHTDQAYELMLRKEYPSWLYPVTKGATTIWERWDGIKPDETFQDVGMNSFNHYAYGAIGEWLYKTVAGIDQKTAGYRETSIHPIPGGKLSHARAFLNSSYGRIESSWDLNQELFTLFIEIPSNTQATVLLPHAEVAEVQESGRNLAEATEGVVSFSQKENGVEIVVGSGRYEFSYPSGELASGLAGELNLTTPVADLVEYDEAKRILENYIPDLLTSVAWNQYGNASLNDLAASYPNQLPSQSLNEIENKLSSIEVRDSRSISADDNLATLITHQQARDLLNQELPELMNSPWLSQVMGYTLGKANQSLPVGLQFGDSILNQIIDKLNELDN